MYIAAAGLGGLAVAALLWRFALELTPDIRGQAVAALPLGRRRAAVFAAVAGGAVGAAVVAAVWPFGPGVLAFAGFAAVSPGLAVIDLVAHRLPFAVSAAVFAAAAASFSAAVMCSGDAASLGRAAWAVVVVGVLALVWWWAFDGRVGLGDVALLAVIAVFAGWLSWAAVWGSIAAGFVLAALAAGVARWRAGRGGAYLPLGPFLLAGWWAVFALYAAGWIGQPS